MRSPEVFVRRDRTGRLNWLAVLPAPAPPAGPSSEKAADAAPEKPAEPIVLSVPEVKISDGQVHVTDLVPQKGFRTDLSGIEAALRGFAVPQAAPAQVELAFGTRSGETVKYAGSLTLTLANFASLDKAKSEAFLRWATLFVGGIAYRHDPMQLAIEEVALSDFYSRIIIYPEGRLNLQEIVVRPEQEAAPDGQEPSTPETAERARPRRRTSSPRCRRA